MMLLMYESSRVKSSVDWLCGVVRTNANSQYCVVLLHSSKLVFSHYCKHVVSTDDRDELK